MLSWKEIRRYHLAIESGCMGAFGSFLGKFAGSPEYDYIWKIIYFILMLSSNIVSVFLFGVALTRTKSTVVVTMITSTVNFVVTAILGRIVFDEEGTLLWWFGFSFILIGIVLMTRDNSKID